MASFNEGAMAELLAEVLGTPEAAELVEEVLGAQAEVSSTSFREAGVLTNNAGLVVRVGRREFQLTVVESTPSYLREPEGGDGSESEVGGDGSYIREDEEEDEDPEACPGCGCLPGDGRTPGCTHPAGCGFRPEEGDDG
jgi:hypothetical protein